MIQSYHKCFIALAVVLLGMSGVAKAESGTVSALAPWEAEGQLFDIGENRILFVGSFNGIMYVESGKGSLDAMIMLCPAVQELNVEDNSTVASGHCSFQGASGDKVYAKFHCAGAVGGCTGQLELTGGTGQFKGITGSGEMNARSFLSELSANLSTGSVVRSAAGLATWPKLEYNIPASGE